MVISNIASHSTPQPLSTTNTRGVDNVSNLQVNNQRLSAIIGDSVELSEAGKSVATAFSDLTAIDNILRSSQDSLQTFASECHRRRDLITSACQIDENYQAKQTKLISALDAEIAERVSKFGDDCVSLINQAASSVLAGDAKLVASGWVSGYRGSTGLSLTASEQAGIKSDIVKVFTSVIEQGDSAGGVVSKENLTKPGKDKLFSVQGQYLNSADFSGKSFYLKLEDSLNSITWKQRISSNMQIYEAAERINRPINMERAIGNNSAWAVNRLYLKGFQHSWESSVIDLEDTSAVDKFSGGLKTILSRFDSAASVHKSHSDLEYDPGVTVEQALEAVGTQLDKKLLAAGSKFFEKHASRVADYANNLSNQQKALLGVMYQDAEALGTDNAFKKVDAFAKAVSTKNFYGFKFEAMANPKNLQVLNMLQWYMDDEASTGVSKELAPQKLSAQERKALLTQKYLPHLVKNDEMIQNTLAHALIKQGKVGEVSRLKLKYRD